MALKKTVSELKDLLTGLIKDLEKAENGNKTAAQRVRTNTIKLEKVGKVYRKQSLDDEKKNKGIKSSKKTAAKDKGTKSKTQAKARALSFKRRPTAKLPTKRRKAAS